MSENNSKPSKFIRLSESNLRTVEANAFTRWFGKTFQGKDYLTPGDASKYFDQLHDPHVSVNDANTAPQRLFNQVYDASAGMPNQYPNYQKDLARRIDRNLVKVDPATGRAIDVDSSAVMKEFRDSISGGNVAGITRSLGNVFNFLTKRNVVDLKNLVFEVYPAGQPAKSIMTNMDEFMKNVISDPKYYQKMHIDDYLFGQAVTNLQMLSLQNYGRDQSVNKAIKYAVAGLVALGALFSAGKALVGVPTAKEMGTSPVEQAAAAQQRGQTPAPGSGTSTPGSAPTPNSSGSSYDYSVSPSKDFGNYDYSKEIFNSSDSKVVVAQEQEPNPRLLSPDELAQAFTTILGPSHGRDKEAVAKALELIAIQKSLGDKVTLALQDRMNKAQQQAAPQAKAGIN